VYVWTLEQLSKLASFFFVMKLVSPSFGRCFATSSQWRLNCRATLNQVLYFVGLKSTTPTVACALANTLPALTFVIAAALKMETVRTATPAGQAKLVGTIVCVGGSMIMPFYKGPLLRVWASPIHWRFAEHTASAVPAAAAGHSAVLGDVLIIGSCLAWAIWFIIQASRLSAFWFADYLNLITWPKRCLQIN
jgi:drug/metabolite transporter (DMT)-like permease